MRKPRTLFSVLVIIFLFTGISNATGLLTENFSYTAGDDILTHGWNVTGSATTPVITVSTTGGSTGLYYNGYAGSAVGLSVTLATSGEDDNKLLSTPITSGYAYVAAMVKVTSAQTSGDYFFHFFSGGNTFYARLYIKSTSGGFFFGIGKFNETPQYETTVRAIGTTYLVVLKYTFNTGTSTDDQVALFVNPTLGSEPSSPTLAITASTADATTITGIGLRQGSSGSAAVVTIDGINAGTTWADVTPSGTPASTFTSIGTLTSFSQNSALPSAEQTYTISGTGETANVTVVPPTGFEISRTTGSGFVNSTSSLVFTASEIIAGKTIFVRMNTSTPGSNSGNITHTSANGEFSQVTQAVSGIYTPPCVLSLTALIQARYNGSIMVPDTVTVELHDGSSYALVDQDKELLSTSGTGTFSFSSAVNGSSYYIAVKHRNSIETWSSSAQHFTSNALSYNFTTASTQAYGGNLILQYGKYCIYSGDVNQDGIINSDDFTSVNNDNSIGGMLPDGYHLVNDLNGDGRITGDDFVCIDNNASNEVSRNVPSLPSISITGTLLPFSQTSATPSAEQTYNISGSNLSANVTVVPPTGFEISKTTLSGFVNSTSSLIFTAADIIAGKTIYVRMNVGSSGSYSGNITHTSSASEFTQVTKAVSGTYSVIVISNVNLTMGNPTGATTDVNNIHNYLLDKPQFCASYDRDKGIPNWTSWQLNSTWSNGPAARKDNYIPDSDLPSSYYHVDDNDYSGSGFSRGHMCPSADRLDTQADNDALFVYTNMVPQNQNNNAGAWEGLETYERTLANAGNVLYIISGGYGAGGTKTDNSATVSTISGGKVTVPAKLWKVIIVIPNGSGDDISRVTTSTRTIAMIIPNDSTPNSTSTWGNYRVSVDAVEALTGYDFFSNVAPSIQAVIESKVDSGPTN